LIGVKRVAQVRLLTTPEQTAALLATLHACNAAASWLSGQMYTARIFRKFEVQKRFYGELRERFGLAAQRFAADVNHQISKRIVAEAERTGRGIAVEDLGGIRGRVRLRKPQRATLHSWAFAQLGQFLAYKAEQVGVVFVQVDPAYTSQQCHRCGSIDKKNRRSQASFICGRCGFVGHADHNAARNIAQRGVVCWGEVMRPDAAPTLAASQGGSSKPIGTPQRKVRATSPLLLGRVHGISKPAENITGRTSTPKPSNFASGIIAASSYARSLLSTSTM
jgi:IS605 OrfB family transposase